MERQRDAEAKGDEEEVVVGRSDEKRVRYWPVALLCVVGCQRPSSVHLVDRGGVSCVSLLSRRNGGRRVAGCEGCVQGCQKDGCSGQEVPTMPWQGSSNGVQRRLA